MGIPRKSIQYEINEHGCHICNSHKVIEGNYPCITINGKMTPISRLIFELFHKPIPPHHLVRHKCDNRLCINPYHLELGTYTDNVRDMLKRGRNRPAKGSQNGMSKLTEQEVLKIYKSKEDTRILATKYKVHSTTIQGIRSGKHWKQVTSPL